MFVVRTMAQELVDCNAYKMRGEYKLVMQPGFQIADLRCRIRAEYFGEEWARIHAQKSHYEGTWTCWRSKKDEIVMIKFDQDPRGCQNPLKSLLAPNFEFEFIDFADGRPPPTLSGTHPIPITRMHSLMCS